MLQLRKEKHCETTKTYYPALSAAVCMMCVCAFANKSHRGQQQPTVYFCEEQQLRSCHHHCALFLNQLLFETTRKIYFSKAILMNQSVDITDNCYPNQFLAHIASSVGLLTNMMACHQGYRGGNRQHIPCLIQPFSLSYFYEKVSPEQARENKGG